MISVLQVCGNLEIGGLQTVAMNCVRFADKSTVHFDFLVYGEHIGYYEEEAEKLGCRVIHMQKSNNYVLFYKNLKQVFKTYGPYDIVYSHTFFNSGIVLKAAKSCGIKQCVAHAHSIKRQNSDCLKKRFFYGIMRKLLHKYANVRFACSPAAGKFVFGNDDFIVIKNGIQTDSFRYSIESRKKIRSQFDLKSQFVIGNIGRLSEPKNQLFLIDVFNNFHIRHPDSILMIVGDGELKDEIKQQIEKLNLSDFVIMTGARDDTYELLSAMDFFLFPSKHEGFGLAAIEAQASGLNVICSDSVPREVQVTNLVRFKSLNDPVQSWVEEIEKTEMNYDRDGYSGIVRENGYDIEDTISQIYSSIGIKERGLS